MVVGRYLPEYICLNFVWQQKITEENMPLLVSNRSTAEGIERSEKPFALEDFFQLETVPL